MVSLDLKSLSNKNLKIEISKRAHQLKQNIETVSQRYAGGFQVSIT